MAPSFFSALTSAKQRAKAEDDSKRLLFLQGVDDWLKNASFSRYKKAPIILNNYEASVAELAGLLGIRERSAKEARLDLSKELYSLLGRDFFDLVSSGSPLDFTEAEKRMSLVGVGVKAESLVRMDALRRIQEEVPDIQYDDSLVNLEDCQEEIKFLLENSTSALERRLGSLSPTKLGFLLSLLDGKVGSYQDRIAFVSRLRGH